MQATSKNLPSVKLSLIPVLSLITLLVINVRLFGDAAIDGSIQIVLLFSTIICVALSMWKQHTKWHRFEAGFVKSIAGSTSAIQVLLFIGAMAGTWMLSGVIPAMIYYGLKFINPTIFLATACSVAAIVSVSSGSSWTTIATIGVGLMGIGKALGIDPGWVAGAVISGGYFGDKISPLSETTNMASGIAG
ncbi:MAG: Na+/H+ antiporter NhaC family protein, partial [Tannerellaceae bacterium]